MIRGLTSTAPSLKKHSKIKENGLSGQTFLRLRRAKWCFALGNVPHAPESATLTVTIIHASTGAVIKFVVVDTGFYLSLGAERPALHLIQFGRSWGSRLHIQFNLIWYGLTRFTKVNGLI